MEVDQRGIERIPVDQGMGDPMDRHMDRRRRSRSPDRFGRGAYKYVVVEQYLSNILIGQWSYV